MTLSRRQAFGAIGKFFAGVALVALAPAAIPKALAAIPPTPVNVPVGPDWKYIRGEVVVPPSPDGITQTLGEQLDTLYHKVWTGLYEKEVENLPVDA